MHMSDKVGAHEAYVLDYHGSLVHSRGLSSTICKGCVMKLYTQGPMAVFCSLITFNLSDMYNFFMNSTRSQHRRRPPSTHFFANLDITITIILLFFLLVKIPPPQTFN